MTDRFGLHCRKTEAPGQETVGRTRRGYDRRELEPSQIGREVARPSFGEVAGEPSVSVHLGMADRLAEGAVIPPSGPRPLASEGGCRQAQDLVGAAGGA